MTTFKESDLYAPVKEMLTNLNFTVKGEVKGCDIAAINEEEELWIVELKRHLSIDLLYQAMDRQSITPNVFVAIPRPQKSDGKGQKILKKLELGLIYVTIDSPIVRAEVVLFPSHSKPSKLSKKAKSLKKEIAGRRGDTPGGSNRMPIVTAYRERCIMVACFLSLTETMSLKELRNFGCEDAGNVIRSGHYGWFVRVRRGQYTLSEIGKKYLKDGANTDVISYYMEYAKNEFAKNCIT